MIPTYSLLRTKTEFAWNVHCCTQIILMSIASGDGNSFNFHWHRHKYRLHTSHLYNVHSGSTHSIRTWNCLYNVICCTQINVLRQQKKKKTTKFVHHIICYSILSEFLLFSWQQIKHRIQINLCPLQPKSICRMNEWPSKVIEIRWALVGNMLKPFSSFYLSWFQKSEFRMRYECGMYENSFLSNHLFEINKYERIE